MNELKPKVKIKKHKKIGPNPQLLKESLRLDMELNKYLLYEYTLQTNMFEEAFNLSAKRRLKDYII